MKSADNPHSKSILEDLTHTLLYEGYALYPYHRSAIKNQKPIPFGVVFPGVYHTYNVHAHSKLQTQCIVTGSKDLLVNISVHFLHLKKTELYDPADYRHIPPDHINICGKPYQAGWQTTERIVSSADLQILQLMQNKKVIPFEFAKINESEYIFDESNTAVANQISNVSEIKGTLMIAAETVENMRNAFRLTVTVINTTPVENAERVTRDEVLAQSFLSTHTVLQTKDASFISHQNPGEKWKAAIAACENINTWPILIDESNSTLLSSPIILYDYPRINPQSSGDLFDSTEIEEALLLHVALLSDEEKKRIAQSDEKMRAMLDKASHVSPGELVDLHSALKEVAPIQSSMKKSES